MHPVPFNEAEGLIEWFFDPHRCRFDEWRFGYDDGAGSSIKRATVTVMNEWVRGGGRVVGRLSRDVEVEIGSEKTKMRARRASDEEKAALWPKLVAMYADYDQYQARTDRNIPVVILSPR